MKNNPFLTANLTINSSRNKSLSHQPMASFQSPSYQSESRRCDPYNPFHRDYLLPQQPDNKYRSRENNHHKSSYNKLGKKRDLEVQWSKEEQMQNHRRYVKAYGIQVLQFKRPEIENSPKFSNQMCFKQNYASNKQKQSIHKNKNKNKYKSSHGQSNDYGGQQESVRQTFGYQSKQNPYQIHINKQKRVSIRVKGQNQQNHGQQIPTFKCTDSQHNITQQLQGRESSLTDMLGSNFYYTKPNPFEISKNNSSLLKFSGNKSKMGYQSYVSGFGLGQSRQMSYLRESDCIMEKTSFFQYPSAINYNGVTFQHVSIS